MIGSVVGWVGAGGNVGGACFSVLFIQFDYQKAFVLMGVMASCSSIFSCFLDCNRLTLNATTPGNEEGKKDEHQHEGIGLTKDTAITFAQLDGTGAHTHSA